MPLPLLFIGIAAASGMLGIGGAVKAGVDTNNAKQINKNANKLVQQSTDCLNAQRLACGNALTQLGAEKLSVLNGTLTAFLDVFTQIKNVDFGETEGLDELLNVIEEILKARKVLIEKVFDYKEAGNIAQIRKYGQLLEERYQEDGIYIRAYVPRDTCARLKL